MLAIATRDVLIQAPDLAAARAYYEGVLGLAVFMDETDILGFEAGALRLFVEKRPAFGPVLEFLVDDLAEAEVRLVAAGCRLVEENPSIPRLYLVDPFGLIFNAGRR